MATTPVYMKPDSFKGAREKFPYPLTQDPAQTRKKEYYLSVVRAMMADYTTNVCAVPFEFGQKRSFAVLRAYAKGQQSPDKIKQTILGHKAKQGDGTYITKMNVSWDTYAKLPQMFDQMRSKNMSQEYGVNLTCVDEDSLAAKESTKEAMKFIVDENTAKWLEPFKYKPNVQPDPTMLGLLNEADVDNYFESGGFTLPWEIAAQAACNKTKQVSNYKVLQDATFDDLIINTEGITGWKTYIDPSDNTPKIRKVFMDRAIVPYSDLNDFADITRAGELRVMTIAQIHTEHPEIPASDLMYIARNFTWMNPIFSKYLANNGATVFNGVAGYSSNFYQNFDLDPVSRVRVLVMDSQWLSVNIETSLENEFPQGDMLYKTVPFGYEADARSQKKGDKVTKRKVIKKFHAQWIVGTEMLLDYGICEDTVYYGEKGNRTPRLDYFFAKTGGQSLIERAIAIVDDMDMILVKHRNAWATLPAAPAMAIQKDLLENVLLNGELQQPEDIVQGLIERGILYYNSLNDKGQPLFFQGGQKPVDYMDVSKMAGMLSVCSSELALKVNELREVLGLQNGADAGQTSPYQGLGQTELAFEASNASLQPTFNSYKYLMRPAFLDIIKKWQIVAKKKEGLKVPYSPLGNKNLKILELSYPFTAADYNVDIDITPTLSEKTALINQIIELNKAYKMTNGTQGISTSEFLRLQEMIMAGNTKAAMYGIARIEAKKQKLAEAKAQQDIQANADVQQQSSAMAGKMESDNIKEKGAQDLAKVMVTELLKMNTALMGELIQVRKPGDQQPDTALAQQVIAENERAVEGILMSAGTPEETQEDPQMQGQEQMQMAPEESMGMPMPQ